MADPTTPQDHDARQSTDRELWRERDDYYADSIHVTEGGGIGMNCGGRVIVMPIRSWHALARKESAMTPPTTDLRRVMELARDMASYVHHSGYPRYDGGHSEPENECQHADCRAVREAAESLTPAPPTKGESDALLSVSPESDGVCPQDGSVCWDSCVEGYCQGVVDGREMERHSKAGETPTPQDWGNKS